MKGIRPIPILYQDEWLVVVHKPPGLLVHPGSEAPDRDTCLSRLRRQLGGGYLQPCHRLDRGTSGALLLALTPEVARSLFAAFQERRVDKTYWALVRGYVSSEEVTMDYALEGRQAVSVIRGVERFCLPFKVGKYPTGRYGLAEVRPQTGRRHQVRRHLKHLTHPIVGDTRYGDSTHNRWFRQLLNWRRLALAARGLGFVHPISGEPLSIECPLAPDFQALLERLRCLGAV